MKYGLVFDQQGGGCDHTIACGTRFEFLEASSDIEAKGLAHKRLLADDGSWLRDGETVIERLTLVRVVDELPIEEWRNAFQAAERQQRDNDRVVDELAEYRRLQQKFEGTP